MLDDFARAHPVSPSQWDTYKDCPRKWAYKTIEKVRRPPNKFAQRGTDVHDVLQGWAQGKEIPKNDAGKIAIPALKFIPLPGVGQDEHEFRFDGDRAVYLGKKDRRLVLPGLRRVWDYKTTTNFKWLKLPGDLKVDAQACGYGEHERRDAAAQGDDRAWVELNWIYMISDPKRPKARRVTLLVLPDGVQAPPAPEDVRPEHFGAMSYSDLDQQWSKIEQQSEIMLGHRRSGARALDLQYNVEACNKYGGCPYRGDPCKLKLSEKLRGYMEQKNIGDRMRAALAEQQQKRQNGAAQAEEQQPAKEPVKTPGTGFKLVRPASSEASAEGKAAAAALGKDKAPPPPPSSGKAAEVQAAPPAVNPPDLSHDLDEVVLAAEMSATIAAGVVAARIVPLNLNDLDGYAAAVGDVAFKIASSIMKRIDAKAARE